MDMTSIMASEDRYASPGNLAQHSRASPRMCEVLFAFARGDPVKVRALRSMSQRKVLIRERQALTWFARAKLKLTYRQIGLAINRDHSTTLHNFRRATRLRRYDKDFRAMCDSLTSNSDA